MFRKLTAILFSLMLLSCLILSVSAEITYVADYAGLLQPEEVAYLEETADSLFQSYGIQAVVLTVDSLEGTSAQDCADDYYDQAGYGEDGVLFLLAMEQREWYISTSGRMIYALTDYGIQQLGDQIVPYLAEEQWFEGFCSFFMALPDYLDAYENGQPVEGFADYSGDYYHGDQEEVVYYPEDSGPNFLVSLLSGIAAGGIAVMIMRFSMNTKRPQHSASEYMTKDSWKLTQHQDLYLYSNVTKVRKQEPSKSSGGGSSVHRSSGGRRHGGGGGKF